MINIHILFLLVDDEFQEDKNSFCSPLHPEPLARM